MTTSNELRAGLLAVAKRSVSIMTACSNEESTKLYLVLPFLGLLGYDYANPYEVYPEHLADFDPATQNKVDFAILRDGAPVIAIECKQVGADLSASRGQLCRYFNALPTVKLGILTNGVLFEFFVDSAAPNIMDDEPFLTIDLETIARSGATDEIVETLVSATKNNYDPETIAEAAHVQLVKKRLRTAFIDEAKGPSEEFCRFALERIGVKSVRKQVIERYYAPMIKIAFEESLIVPVVDRLRAQSLGDVRQSSMGLHQLGQRIETTERELAIVAYVRRRLSYLAENETQFNAIENIRFKDYVGKLSVFYDRERKGRLFDYIEGADGYDKFIFPDPIGEIVTNNVLEIDTALKTVFATRVREIGGLSQGQKISRSA
ncbi:MAG: type I restriction enzyme HsdR N-terminal domain-containing protein [Hyphomicrobium sp.]|nr:type I restriction enzyme HsdR N-terminal domain-containing protein [Hyphomicrobium sp.]